MSSKQMTRWQAKRPKIRLRTALGAGFAVLFLMSAIADPQGLKTSIGTLLLAVGFALVVLRLGGRQLVRIHSFGGTFAQSHGVRCPYCGSTRYTVRVVRKGASQGYDRKNPQEQRKERAARTMSWWTYGLSDRILRKLPGQPYGADVRHYSIGVCSACNGTWKMRKGTYWRN